MSLKLLLSLKKVIRTLTDISVLQLRFCSMHLACGLIISFCCKKNPVILNPAASAFIRRGSAQCAFCLGEYVTTLL